MIRIVICGLFGVASLAAQSNSFVSPPYYTDYGANRGSGYPFNVAGPFGGLSSMRYQQIHNDTQGTAMAVQSLALRPHITRGGTTNPAFTVDMEIRMGLGDRATATGSFAGNYTSPPQTVFSRRVVNIAARSIPLNHGMLLPWDTVFPFDAPFPYSGAADLVWEVIDYRNSNTSVAQVNDTAMQTVLGTAGVQVFRTLLGPSCSIPGFTLSAELSLNGPGGTPELLLAPGVSGNVGAQFGAFMLGFSNPNLPLPNAGCTNTVQTDGSIIVWGALQGGAFGQSWRLPWDSHWAGGDVFVQGVLFTPNQGLFLSHGVQMELPPGAPPTLQATSVVGTSAGAASGSVLARQQLVVRFGH